jgi:hypothetical protein
MVSRRLNAPALMQHQQQEEQAGPNTYSGNINTDRAAGGGGMTIDRLPYDSLSYSAFLQHYAHSFMPVIFTGAFVLTPREGAGGGGSTETWRGMMIKICMRKGELESGAALPVAAARRGGERGGAAPAVCVLSAPGCKTRRCPPAPAPLFPLSCTATLDPCSSWSQLAPPQACTLVGWDIRQLRLLWDTLCPCVKIADTPDCVRAVRLTDCVCKCIYIYICVCVATDAVGSRLWMLLVEGRKR